MAQDHRTDHRTKHRLAEEVEELHRKLDEAEQTLRAIRSGDIDALVINGPQGEQVFSLAGADRQYRTIVETMNEAAVTVSTEGTILYCNRRFCDLTKNPMEMVIGRQFISFVVPQQEAQVKEQIAGVEARPTVRLSMLASDGTRIPAQVSASPLDSPEGRSICLVVSDLSELEASAHSVHVLYEQQQALEQAKDELARRNLELSHSRAAALNSLHEAVEARRQMEYTAEALQRISGRLNLLAETASALLESLSPQQAIGELCRKVMAFLDCQVYMHYLIEPATGQLHLNACAGIPEVEQWRIEWLELASPVCGCAAAEGMRIVTECIGKTEDLVRTYGFEAIESHPLLARDKILGTLSFGTRTRTSFSEEDLALMKAITDQIAIALQRQQDEEALRKSQDRLRVFAEQLEQLVAERTEELTRSQARLRALASELNLAEQRERIRLATELHDHLQQMLVVGKLTIGQGKRVAKNNPQCLDMMKRVDDILSDALTYSRTLVAELSPPVLRDHGLAAALNWLSEYMEQKHEQSVTVIVPEHDDLKLPGDQQVLLFQSVRELLINAAKHAGTGRAVVRMTQYEHEVQIQVRDQGKGFDLAAVGGAGGTPDDGISSKFGLYSIQERMKALGGSFDIRSMPGEGTTATLTLPLAKNQTDSGVWRVSSDAHKSTGASLYTVPHVTKHDKTIRVLLVDDHAMVRQGLRFVLNAYEDIHVVGEAANGAEALRLIEDLLPRVVVMDINMPTMNGIEATTQIKTYWPHLTVVGISINAVDGNSDAMKRVGAAAVLPKDTAVEHLHAAIVQAIDA